jgi:hypothetical protein
MKRKTFDKIVTSIGAILTLFLLVSAGLLNWGATFAADSVENQLANQNISFPAAEAMPLETKEQLAKWAGMQVTTGEMARDYADLYIWEHMKGSAKAGIGREATYSEVSGMYMGAARGGTASPEEIGKLGELRETLFMGNTLRGLLLQAFAFGTLGNIAAIAALASLAGGILLLLLSIAGIVHIRRTPEEATI